MNNNLGNEQSQSFGVHDNDNPVPRDSASEKLNEIPGRHIEADPDPVVDIRSAVHSNYIGMLAMIGADDRVYLGKSENYDNMGHYDNHDDSLCFVSENKDMYYYLYGTGWMRSQADMLDHGLGMEQYREFARMQDGVLRQFEQQRALLFDGKPFQPPENYLRTAEMSQEANYNMLDGSINNKAAARADLTDGQTHDEIQELAPETTIHRPSVLDQLNQYPTGNDSRQAHTFEHERGL